MLTIDEIVQRLEPFDEISVQAPYQDDQEPSVFECISASYPFLLSDPGLCQIFKDTNGISFRTLDTKIAISSFAEFQVPGISMYDFAPFQRFKFAACYRRPFHNLEAVYATYAYPNDTSGISEILVKRFQDAEETDIVLWRGPTFTDWFNRLIETSGSF